MFFCSGKMRYQVFFPVTGFSSCVFPCSVRGLWFAVCGLRFSVCGLRFAVCGLRFAVCGLRFVVCGLRFAMDMATRHKHASFSVQPRAAGSKRKAAGGHAGMLRRAKTRAAASGKGDFPACTWPTAEPSGRRVVLVDVPMCRCADVPMCRCADVPMCRVADAPMC